MVLAVRRYRIYLLVAVLTALSFYYLTGGHHRSFAEGIGYDRRILGDSHIDERPPNGGRVFPPRPDLDGTTNTNPPAILQPPTATDEKIVIPDVNAALPKSPNLNPIDDGKSTQPDTWGQGSTAGDKPKVFEKEGQKIEDDVRTPAKAPANYLKDSYAVADTELISLPSDTPQTFPRIQYTFGTESATEKADRVKKQVIIRKSFEHAWNGYKTHAMGHDELKPLTRAGANQTQFMGWGATLVDSLDTLWIMGLEDEFDEAIREVAKINFKSSTSEKIPLFETVIRYLGGLISAYDLTGGKQPILLNKAVELADVLMGAFETPNRMPIPYYYWNATDRTEAPMSHRNTVLAELGSLSMEFTRLAQLTKKNKYYDAIARITNALEKFQPDTRMPGLWPLRLDASGCKDNTKPLAPAREPPRKAVQEPEHIKDPYDHPDLRNVPEAKAEPPKQIKDPYDHDLSDGEESPKAPSGQSQFRERLHKRDESSSTAQSLQPRQVPGCDPQGLRHEPNPIISFGIGGLADSVYEYMPKTYALLGGQNKQYRAMYDYAMKTVKDQLLFRPMIPDADRSILFVARQEYNLNIRDPEHQKTKIWEATHLGCFAGGMFGLASRLFDNHKDMELAKKLTDGCAWAYESTPAGVMPEAFNLVPCENQHSCPWNEKRWHQILDFAEPGRVQDVTNWNKNQEAIYGDAGSASGDVDTRETVDDQVDRLAPKKPTAMVQKGGIRKEYDPLQRRAVEIEETADDDEHTVRNAPRAADDVADEILEQEEGLSTGSSSKKSPATVIKESQTGVKGIDSTESIDDDEDVEDENEDEGDPTDSTRKSSAKTSTKAAEYVSSSKSASFRRKSALSHEQYVKAKIEEERLPRGYTSIFDRSYKLRPEAIESVFIMWRLTGDNYWREKGWMMFEAIQKITLTDVGNAAVADVTSVLGANRDSMESFWLAETLKYFYLLFSEPDLISLDDYVFNTEAHPFKIPKEKTSPRM